MDLTTVLAQLVSTVHIVIRGKMFFNFWALLLKMYIVEVVTFFPCQVVIQSTQFFSGSTYLFVFFIGY